MKRIVALLLLVVVLFSGCGAPDVVEDYGSFTMDKTYNYNNDYYAKVTRFNNDEGVLVAVVDIYLAANDVVKDSIIIGASDEFWGFCWENDSNNIWIQLADKGCVCYKKELYEWVLDENAEKPDYITEKAK